MIILGALVLILGLPERGISGWSLAKETELGPDSPDFPAIPSHFPIEVLRTYRVMPPSRKAIYAQVAVFQDGKNRAETALLSMQSKPVPGQISQHWEETDRRYSIWVEAARAIQKHAEPNALIIAWWDNAQRACLFTGLETWVYQPAAAGFTDAGERTVWEVLGGGFTKDGKRLQTLAQWFTLDTPNALEMLKTHLPADRPVYFLVTVDDLTHLREMEALGGKKLALKSAVFPTSGDIHGLVSSVKRWLEEQGGHGYLVQPLSPGSIRAWTKPTHARGEDTVMYPSLGIEEHQEALLVRMLPFSDSMARPLDSFQLVYQSAWGAYLSIYRWHYDGMNK